MVLKRYQDAKAVKCPNPFFRFECANFRIPIGQIVQCREVLEKSGIGQRRLLLREFPYPGDEEAMEEFVAKGGMIGTTIGPKGFVETDKDAFNYQKELQKKKLEQEAQKLWVRMKNEVISELQEKGYVVEAE
ncbi:hypothetical protein C1H46_013488 [Malus baccata]|uniref:Uncharacterized protein n=1 Tax=Malus baccata TaxID=106549 RepID=A0A540MQ94_MALBA|nr:hypothetical protein C1H46_013488 [Malus baccata]